MNGIISQLIETCLLFIFLILLYSYLLQRGIIIKYSEYETPRRLSLDLVLSSYKYREIERVGRYPYIYTQKGRGTGSSFGERMRFQLTKIRFTKIPLVFFQVFFTQWKRSSSSVSLVKIVQCCLFKSQNSEFKNFGQFARIVPYFPYQ